VSADSEAISSKEAREHTISRFIEVTAREMYPCAAAGIWCKVTVAGESQVYTKYISGACRASRPPEAPGSVKKLIVSGTEHAAPG
jgi:hypothetical protein